MSGDRQHYNSIELNPIYLRAESTAQGQLYKQHSLYTIQYNTIIQYNVHR